MSHEPSDQALLTAHTDGDPTAFAELVRRHRDRLWRVALHTTGDPEEAADALQDALLAAFRRAGTFRGDAAVTTWLHRIVVNACLDRLRRRTSRRTVPLPDDPGSAAELTTHSGADSDASELRRDVARALACIGADQRAALVLVDMEGYSVEEAAAVLGCPVGTVKSRCARGRARLAPLLSAYRGNVDQPGAVQPVPTPQPQSQPEAGHRDTGELLT
ncbi:MAG TPA: RNA polymerase sigma factor SigM [Nocardioidaceae bacterium]|nr:RNA polymerase sigma factor SigM [Nocardioidaceae bacterium]